MNKGAVVGPLTYMVRCLVQCNLLKCYSIFILACDNQMQANVIFRKQKKSKIF